MDFDPAKYGPEVARVLALDGNGNRLMPLTCGPCSSEEGHRILKTWKPSQVFPASDDAKAAMAGLWLYFSCFEEAHQLADSCSSTEGYLWHAIVHRQEGDSGNSAYWFRKAHAHPVFDALSTEAASILVRYPRAEFRVGHWDPYAFLSFCDRARQQPGSSHAQAALEIQRAEWQILFDYCALGAR
ncbi:MAG TPA: hypothetical protein VGG72_32360 [Bryobacteraceae bacterium]